MVLQHHLQSWNILCLQVLPGCVQELTCHLPDQQKQRNGRDHFFLRWINFTNRIRVWQRVGKLNITIFHWRYIYEWRVWLPYFSLGKERKITWSFSLSERKTLNGKGITLLLGSLPTVLDSGPVLWEVFLKSTRRARSQVAPWCIAFNSISQIQLGVWWEVSIPTWT